MINFSSFFKLAVLTFFSLIVGSAFAQQSINVNKIDKYIKVSQYQHINTTDVELKSIDSLLTLPSNAWLNVKSGTSTLGVKKGTNWYKIDIQNTDTKTQNTIVVLPNRVQLSSIDLYFINQEKKLEKVDFILSKINIFFGEINLAKYSSSSLFLRVKSDVKLSVPLYIYQENHFLDYSANKHFDNGLSIGGLLFASLIFIMLFLTTNDRTTGLLAAYLIVRTLIFSVLTGGSLYFIFDQQEELRGFELPILACLAGVFYFGFTSAFFRLKSQEPQIHLFLKQCMWLMLACIPLSLALTVNANLIMVTLLHFFITVCLAVVGLNLFKKGYRLALLFTSVVVFQLAVGFINLSMPYIASKGFIHIEPSHQFSFWTSTILIILVICRQYYYQIQDRNKMQLSALESAVSSKKSQEEIVKLQNENQQRLEDRVQERTLELNIALQELEELNRELEQKNTLDELTGLFNRRFYDQKILAEYRRSKRNLTPLSLILIDIDHFKAVNDGYGHLAGDQCLHWVGEHIKQGLKRSTDVGCRYGGEEFCIILPDTDAEGAVALAELIRESVAKFNFVYQEQAITITVSCGISTYTQQKDTFPEHIFVAADKALYQAKHNGRNQICQHSISNQLTLKEENNE